MSYIKKHRFWIIAVLITALFPSCANLKNISHKKQAEKQLQQVFEENASTRTIVSKVNVNFESYSRIAGQIKLQDDSCLWISIQPFLGIEAFRVLLTRDRLQAMNRLKKEYIDEDLSLWNLPQKEWILPCLNRIFLNRIFVPGKMQPEVKDFDILFTKNDKIVLKRDEEDFQLEFEFDNQNKMTGICLYSPYTKGPVSIQYSIFQEIDGKTFPCRINIDATDLEDHHYALQLDYVKPDLNAQSGYNFSISGNYQKSDIQQMLKIKK